MASRRILCIYIIYVYTYNGIFDDSGGVVRKAELYRLREVYISR